MIISVCCGLGCGRGEGLGQHATRRSDTSNEDKMWRGAAGMDVIDASEDQAAVQKTKRQTNNRVNKSKTSRKPEMPGQMVVLFGPFGRAGFASRERQVRDPTRLIDD